MFHKFTVIQMFTDLPRLLTTAINLATFGWRNCFYACRFGLEFRQMESICKLLHGSKAATATPAGSGLSRIA